MKSLNTKRFSDESKIQCGGGGGGGGGGRRLHKNIKSPLLGDLIMKIKIYSKINSE